MNSVRFASGIIAAGCLSMTISLAAGAEDAPSHQRILTPEQRAAIVSFAKAAKPQHIFVVARDGAERITYADAIANAFEDGGWTVDGRRSDGQRFVTHEIGEPLPDEVPFAVGPNPQALKLAAALEKVGIHSAELPPNQKHGDEIVVWVGAQK
jgi:hypothetical protein